MSATHVSPYFSIMFMVYWLYNFCLHNSVSTIFIRSFLDFPICRRTVVIDSWYGKMAANEKNCSNDCRRIL